MLLVIGLREGRTIEIALFSGRRVLKHFSERTGQKVSETLWRMIAQTFTHRRSEELTAAGLWYDPREVTFSGIRSALSILNTLSVLSRIPLIDTTRARSQREALPIIRMNVKKFPKRKRLIPTYGG